jgi:hypothetical protein
MVMFAKRHWTWKSASHWLCTKNHVNPDNHVIL